MAEVSFYILSSHSQQERIGFACRLIEKAYRSKQFCYVYTDNLQQSQQIDDLLWTFRPTSFVPHQIYQGTTPDYQQTILIGSDLAPENWQSLILNLSSKYPENISRTQRILEILDNNEAVKQPGRERYQLYNKAGFNLTTHNS